MGEKLRCYSIKKLESKDITSAEQPSDSLVSRTSKDFSQKTFECVNSMKQVVLGGGACGDIGLFIVKTAALEIVRRYSRAKCPVVWQGLQALEVLCHLPFKWIQTWAPFKALAKYMKALSRPLLVLSITTLLSDQSWCSTEKLDGQDESKTYTESKQEPLAPLSAIGSRPCDQASESAATEKWLEELQKELERQGITVPERLNKDELRRFYDAANGGYSKFISSIKKTIHWRQAYTFMSPEELEVWSELVFWHGFDLQLRPCLIIRLGLACANLGSSNRAVFAKAVISRIEHRILQLASTENPQITVLMDCMGLTPFGFPIQMMRSCAILLQDHYPNRLGYLIAVRLPPVARMITQTLFQVMRPATQQKLRIIGENYQEALTGYLQTLPSFLGGQCSCPKCSGQADLHYMNEDTSQKRQTRRLDDENKPFPTLPELDHTRVNQNGGQIQRVAVIGILMVWIFIVLVMARHYPDSLSLLYWQGGS
ncbi:hypothetical protein NMG60_11012482 [Bertholletia excelsa]